MKENNQMQASKDKKAENEETENTAMEDVVVRDNTKRKKQLVVAVSAALVLLVALIAGISVFGNSERKLQEQLDLGAKYLEEMDYEQALVAFNAALAIEPKNADAYLGIVEVYIRTNEFELALETAKEGYDVTGDERLKEKIDMIESGNIFASNGWEMKMSGYDGEGNLTFWHEFTYNLKGQKASVAKYNVQGVQEQYLELAYDEEGRALIGYAYSIMKGEEGNLLKCVLKYNGNNYRETRYEGTGDVIEGYTDVEVDSDGNILKLTEYSEDDSVVYVEAYEYDGEGKPIKSVSYNSDNELQWYHIYTYNKDGNRLQVQYYDSNNMLTSYLEYVYDEGGNYIGHRDYDADGVLQFETISQ